MRLRLHEIELPLLRPLHTALGTVESRRSILIEATTPDGTGWGEAAPYPGTDAETLDDVWTAFVQGGPLPPTAMAAVDAARHDAAARAAGLPLADLVAPAGRTPTPSRAIGGDEDAVMSAVTAAVADGCGAIKLKVDGRTPAHLVARIRRDHPDLILGADANGSLPDLAAAQAFADAGATYLEQPFPSDDLDLHRRLRARIDGCEIVLDESVRSEADAVAIIEFGAADRLCLKPMRIGTTTCRAIAVRAAAAGVGTKASGMFDSAVGRAFVDAIARLPGSAYDDLAPPGSYFLSDVGRAEAGVPGIGFDPRPGDLSVRSEELTWRGTVSSWPT